MADEVTSAANIAQIVAAASEMETVQELQFDQTAMKNELLLFVKPEVFLVNSQELVEKTIDLVFQKMADYGAQSSGIVAMTGANLLRTGAMSRHYGLINRLSTAASQIVTPDEAKAIAKRLGMSVEHPVILGGHEYLSRHPGIDADQLNSMWRSEDVNADRIRSGFYVRPIESDGQAIVLVNGFHPQQLAHYTDPSHRILLVLMHSNTEWKVLRNQMVGATYPKEADPASIRGTLYADPTAYGFDSVSVENNAVHLSAGPFEAMFELYNFFGDLLGLDAEQQKPLVLKRMLDQGVAPDLALRVLDNPRVTNGAKDTDLFSATEDVDTDDAIKFWTQRQVNLT